MASTDKPKQKQEDLDLDIKVGTVAGHNGETLRGLDLKLSRRDGRVRTFAITSKIGRDTPLNGDLRVRARDNHQVIYRIVLEEFSKLGDAEAAAKRLLFTDVQFETIRDDVGGLSCSWQRTAQNIVKRNIEGSKKFGHFAHLFFTMLGQRPFVIRPVPVRPIGFAMS